MTVKSIKRGTDVVKASRSQSLGEVRRKQEACEERKEQMVRVAGQSFTGTTAPPTARQQLQTHMWKEKRAFISAVYTMRIYNWLICMRSEVWPYLHGRTVGSYQRGRGRQTRPFARFYFCVGTATLQTC